MSDEGKKMTKEEIEERIKAIHEDMIFQYYALFPSDHGYLDEELARLNKLLEEVDKEVRDETRID